MYKRDFLTGESDNIALNTRKKTCVNIPSSSGALYLIYFFYLLCSQGSEGEGEDGKAYQAKCR